MSLTTAISEDDDAESVHNSTSPYKVRDPPLAITSFLKLMKPIYVLCMLYKINGQLLAFLTLTFLP